MAWTIASISMPEIIGSGPSWLRLPWRCCALLPVTSVEICSKVALLQIKHIEADIDRAFSPTGYMEDEKRRQKFDEAYFKVARLSRQLFRHLSVVPDGVPSHALGDDQMSGGQFTTHTRKFATTSCVGTTVIVPAAKEVTLGAESRGWLYTGVPEMDASTDRGSFFMGFPEEGWWTRELRVGSLGKWVEFELARGPGAVSRPGMGKKTTPRPPTP